MCANETFHDIALHCHALQCQIIMYKICYIVEKSIINDKDLLLSSPLKF